MTSRSIRQKLNFILVVTTMLALTVAGVALVLFDQKSSLLSVEKDLVTQAEIIALVSSSALAFDDAKVATENLSVLRVKPNVTAAALFDKDGRVFAYFRPEERNGQAIPMVAQSSEVHIDGQWVRVWRPVLSDRANVGMVYLEARHGLGGRAREYAGILLLILTSSLGVALLLSNRLQATLTGPVVSVSNVARQILHRRDFSLRAPKVSNDEVGTLVDLFNAMLDELGARANTLEQANEALRQSDDRYQLAVRGSSAGLWDWDMVRGTTFYSPRFKALLGYSDEEFPDLPSSLSEIMHEEDRPLVRDSLHAHLNLGMPYHVECRLRQKSGQWRWFLLAGMATRDLQGRGLRMAGSVIDVTERKEAEHVLRDANRAKDEFLATLAHELRNPLAPLRNGLDILKRDKGNGAASQQARAIMERQLVHMIRLIDDLLDISRINSGKIQLATSRIDLASAIHTAVELSRPTLEARRHQLELDLQPSSIFMQADATRLAQAIGNLLNNAAKYTPQGGHITITARVQDGTAVVEVRDDGVGISGEMLDRVFSLFTQVGRTLDHAQGGLGIGLYLVRSLVELHGGTVTAFSGGTGQGSTFTMRLPCVLRSQGDGTPAEDVAENVSTTSALRVLVVDDNVDAADTVATVLSMMGHDTKIVYDGESVLPAANDFDPDVVLLDIGLPGMSGYEVAKLLRANPRFRQTFLIALTGWGSEVDRRRSSEAGFDEHVTKPVDPENLEFLLSRQVSE